MTSQLKMPALDSDGTLPTSAWPGGYPLIYLDRENSVLCPVCATKSLLDPDEVPQFKPVACDIYYEGPSEWCSQCNVEIESAYGDPDNPDDEHEQAQTEPVSVQSALTPKQKDHEQEESK